jgi:hypothetical protein
MQKSIIVVCILGVLLTGCGSSNEPLARIAAIEGKVDARPELNGAFAAAKVDMQLKHQGAVRTDKESTAALEDMARKGSVKIAPDSYYEVRAGVTLGFHGAGKAVFDVNKQQTEIQIETPHGNTAVLGTKFGQIVASDSFELWVEEGTVEFTARDGSKQRVTGSQKLQWQVQQGALPQPVNFNLLESEDFFGKKDESFKFNTR